MLAYVWYGLYTYISDSLKLNSVELKLSCENVDSQSDNCMKLKGIRPMRYVNECIPSRLRSKISHNDCSRAKEMPKISDF